MKNPKGKALAQLRDKNFERRREMRGKKSTSRILKEVDTD